MSDDNTRDGPLHLVTNNGVHTTSGFKAPTNAEFLTAIFKTQFNQAHVTVFHQDPSAIPQSQRGLCWYGGHWGNRQGEFQQGGNQYFTISLFKLDDGTARRRKALFRETHVIVVDDVGHGTSAKVDPADHRLPPPSYKLLTSPGNEQWGYILSLPETSRPRVENLLDGMVSQNLCADGADPGMKGVTRYVRLPEGTNNKQKYIELLSRPFACRMTHWEPENTISIDVLAQSFGIDLNAAREEKEGISVDDENHPSLRAYGALYGVKSRIEAGRYDVTCPWLEGHTDGDDSGTAVWTYPDGRLGFKCHHGHCEDKSGQHIMAQLFDDDPDLQSRVAMYGVDFSPVTTPAPPAPAVTIDNATQVPVVDVRHLCEGAVPLMAPAEINPIFTAIAGIDSPVEREVCISILKDRTTLGLAVLRSEVNARMRLSAPAVPRAFVDINPNTDQPLATIDNFRVLLAIEGYQVRYNMMTRSHETTVPAGTEVLEDAKELAGLTLIESQWLRHNMPNLGQVKGYHDLVGYQNAFHPFHEWLDLQQMLNGPYRPDLERDYVQDLSNTLVVDPGQERLRDILLKRWLVSVVAQSYAKWGDDDTPPARGILTLQSRQFLGKSYWFQHLVPPGMSKVGAQIVRNDMNHLKTATNRLIVELAETEFSHGAGDMVNFIKAIVGRSEDEMREAYARKEVRLLRRSVFCATTNEGTYLVDDENTRWWTIAVKDINRDLYNSIVVERLWAQVLYLYQQGEAYILTREELDMLQEVNEEHRTLTNFEEWLLDTFHFDTMEGQGEVANRLMPTELALLYKQYAGTAPDDKVKSRLHTMGVKQRKSSGTRYYAMPAKRAPKA